MFRNAFEPWHLIVLIVLVAILFGWKKLPDAARSLGRSMRIFKAEVEEMKHDGPHESAASKETVDGERVHRAEDRAGGATEATQARRDATGGEAHDESAHSRNA